MAVELSTALAGLATAQERLRASANNLAVAGSRLQQNNELQGRPLNQGVQTEFQLNREDPDLARSLIEQRSAAYQFVANLRVLQTQLRLSGAASWICPPASTVSSLWSTWRWTRSTTRWAPWASARRSASARPWAACCAGARGPWTPSAATTTRFAVLLSGVGLATAHSRMEGLRRQCATQIVCSTARNWASRWPWAWPASRTRRIRRTNWSVACEAALAEAKRRGGNHVTLASIRFEAADPRGSAGASARSMRHSHVAGQAEQQHGEHPLEPLGVGRCAARRPAAPQHAATGITPASAGR
jgi:hypothetical protein